MITFVVAAEHPRAADAKHNAGAPAACEHTMHIDRIVVDIITVAEVFPCFATVFRADDAADLDGAIQQVRAALTRRYH